MRCVGPCDENFGVDEVFWDRSSDIVGVEAHAEAFKELGIEINGGWVEKLHPRGFAPDTGARLRLFCR